MSSQPKVVSPLRQRMIEDMRMRKLAPHTQAGYIRAVRQFARYLNRSPDTATAEDFRNFQLYLVDHGASPITLNATIMGLKFSFGVTLNRGALMAKMQHVFVPRTLPVVLSRDEVKRPIAAAGNLKYQTALSVTYGARLRASEVVALRITDVESQRMVLRVQKGKDSKDRYAMLSPVMLERLRTGYRVARGHGKMPDGGWLFPGRDPIDPMSTRQLNRAVHGVFRLDLQGECLPPTTAELTVSFTDKRRLCGPTFKNSAAELLRRESSKMSSSPRPRANCASGSLH